MKTKKKWLSELFDYLKENYIDKDEFIRKHFEELDEIETGLAHKRKLRAERKFLKELESKTEIKDNTELEDEITIRQQLNIEVPEEHICEYTVPQDVRDFIYPLVLVEEQRFIIYGHEVPVIIKKTKDLLK